MHIVDVHDVDVGAEGPRYQLKLLVLGPYFANQVFSLFIHRLKKILQEFLFIVDPGSLVLYVADCVALWIANNQDVLHTLLFFQFMKRIGVVIADFLENEWLFSQYFFFVIPIIDNLNGDLIIWLHDIKRKHFAPFWTHAIWLLDHLSMLYLLDGLPKLHVIQPVTRLSYDLNHGLKLINIKELLIKLAIDDCERQSTAFHYWHIINKVACFSLFQGC